MKCPNCGFDFSEGFRCPRCEMDSFVFIRTRNISIRCYNSALIKANAQDLSGAIDDLQQSLLFDKNNIQARNLLGLIYCEMGRIGDALTHWIISTSFVKENNPAVGYMDFLQKNGRAMEKANDAVRMYNQALQYLKHGSEDLAIIQLKKSIDSNPDFIDAYNLLILCCIDENNTKRAQSFIDLVLKKDCKNPIALHYAKILYPDNENGFIKKIERKTAAKAEQPSLLPSDKKTDSAPPLPRYRRKEKTSNAILEKRDIIAFVSGVFITAIVLMVLVVPAVNENNEATIAELQTRVDSYAGDTGMTPDEVLTMRTEYNALLEENRLLRSEETKQANLELLQTAVSQLSDENYIACVATIDSIDTLGFSEEDLSKYNSVRATAYPRAADALYTKGQSEYFSNKFTEAKASFEATLVYASNENFVDDAYFYLGKIAEGENDNETAAQYYQRVIAEYPDSNQLANAENALAHITTQ